MEDVSLKINKIWVIWSSVHLLNKSNQNRYSLMKIILSAHFIYQLFIIYADSNCTVMCDKKNLSVKKIACMLKMLYIVSILLY